MLKRQGIAECERDFEASRLSRYSSMRMSATSSFNPGACLAKPVQEVAPSAFGIGATGDDVDFIEAEHARWPNYDSPGT